MHLFLLYCHQSNPKQFKRALLRKFILNTNAYVSRVMITSSDFFLIEINCWVFFFITLKAMYVHTNSNSSKICTVENRNSAYYQYPEHLSVQICRIICGLKNTHKHTHIHTHIHTGYSSKYKERKRQNEIHESTGEEERDTKERLSYTEVAFTSK